jgi:predicted DsbA family dithiol-disulfide isomerase
MAEERGLSLHLPPVQPRSRKAFEAAALARDAGRFDPMHRALFKAFFEEGRDIADPAVLLDVGRSVGLDENALRDSLQDERYVGEVLDNQRQAQELGISSVPALIVVGGDQAYLISGAQPLEMVRRAVETAGAARKSGDD